FTPHETNVKHIFQSLKWKKLIYFQVALPEDVTDVTLDYRRTSYTVDRWDWYDMTNSIFILKEGPFYTNVEFF
ncbi:hypothetical protein PMAYCL1PPCAC_03173, partial [Pristionchus mayeri]